MPVFHTKTIEAILEPVAQQVSQLVILHEEGEDGKAMPDLSNPIMAVGAAVANLVKVGKETATQSKDKILKQEMPLAFTRVEESSMLLVQASKLLKRDPYSSEARQKLIDGARGILSGTSALLLTFDEAEVRKIVTFCRSLLEYLPVGEMVEEMQDLLTFVANLSPAIQNVAKAVESRAAELTHTVHRDMLKSSLSKLSGMVPLLISSMKAFVKTPPGAGRPEAQESRNFIINKMSAEITEIIRVLQLTSYDEDGGDDPMYDMKKAASVFDAKFDKAKEWVRDPTCHPGGLGEKAVRECIQQGRVLGSMSQDSDRARVEQVCDDLDQLMGELALLRAQGKGTTPRGLELSGAVDKRLDSLKNNIGDALQHQNISGAKKPTDTIVGKVEQAQQWLNNPAGDHTRLGEKAIRQCIADARKVAEKCSGPERLELLRLCDDLEKMVTELAELKRRGMGNSPQAHALARSINKKLEELNQRVQKAVVGQVAEDFMDTTTALRNLEKAARAPVGTPRREEDFEAKAGTFEHQANQFADTAIRLANAGGNTNRILLDNLRKAAKEVKDLTPQVSHVAKVLLENPNEPAVSDHFDAMKEDWLDSVNNLTDLVDVATDTAQFIDACADAINKEVDSCEYAMAQENPQLVAAKSSNIARLANRVIKVAKTEAEYSEDPAYVAELNDKVGNLEQAISPLIIDAKSVATNIKDKNAHKRLRASMRRVRHIIPHPRPPDVEPLHIGERAPPRPPLPREDVAPAPPRPPPPQEEKTIDMNVQSMLDSPPEDNRIAVSKRDHLPLTAPLRLYPHMLRYFHFCEKKNSGPDTKNYRTMMQTIDRIPTISTQLKIVATVKATMIGAQEMDEDREATETLVGCAENLMSAVRQTVRETEAASVKMRSDAGYVMRWKKKDY
ncbi:predicted protein [Nematostella vectensis]|uniref:Vinculin n=1 Tax=Nematostella vectensis TaxID=45351 RepID=A7SKI3_NEMVE|nr:predicted protein [Nematostella vectensis]|eukprot:XP_001627825.1 predicted protein [Nematostella vectensis]